MDNNNTWNSALILGKELIDKKMEVIQQRVENNQEVEGEYLTYLLSNAQMSTKDVYGSITELLLAGVDTVNHDTKMTFWKKHVKYQKLNWASTQIQNVFNVSTPFLQVCIFMPVY